MVFNYSGHTANTSYRVVRLANGTLLAATSNIHDIYQSTYLTDARLDGMQRMPMVKSFTVPTMDRAGSC